MYEFTWKVFKETGNVDIYLLLKELEKDENINSSMLVEDVAEVDYPVN
jgi:hypothetical protein